MERQATSTPTRCPCQAAPAVRRQAARGNIGSTILALLGRPRPAAGCDVNGKLVGDACRKAGLGRKPGGRCSSSRRRRHGRLPPPRHTNSASACCAVTCALPSRGVDAKRLIDRNAGARGQALRPSQGTVGAALGRCHSGNVPQPRGRGACRLLCPRPARMLTWAIWRAARRPGRPHRRRPPSGCRPSCMQAVVHEEGDGEPECWICLGGGGDDDVDRNQLFQPCSCPRHVHPLCLARWQLQQAGKAEERCCRWVCPLNSWAAGRAGAGARRPAAAGRAAARLLAPPKSGAASAIDPPPPQPAPGLAPTPPRVRPARPGSTVRTAPALLVAVLCGAPR